MRLIGTISAMVACIAVGGGCSRTADPGGQWNQDRPGRTNMQPREPRDTKRSGSTSPGSTNTTGDGGAYRSGPPEQTPATQTSADSLQSWDGSSSQVSPLEYESPPGGIAPSPESTDSPPPRSP